MRIFDPKFVKNKKAYIGQCAFAAVIIFAVLLFMNIVYDIVVAASIGASAFIAFTMPHANSSRPRYLIGGYFVGAVCGSLMNYLFYHLTVQGSQIFNGREHVLMVVSGALAVGFAMFFMTLFNFEHPPAVALALGLTREEHVLAAALAALFSIILMAGMKSLFKRKFMNLL